MRNPIIYKKKIIISGSTVEILSYEIPITHGFEISPKWREKRRLAKLSAKANLSEQQLQERRKRNRKLAMIRASKTLIRLIDCNVYQYKNTVGRIYLPVFLTLTFKEDVREQKEANRLFTLFIKRLNYHVNKKIRNPLRYSVVIEFQDLNRKGVIHYHTLFYDLPFIRSTTLENLWGEGSININKVHKVKKIGLYVSKYMSKNFEDPRLDGHKRYFSSRGLIKPKTYAGEEAYRIVKSVIPTEVTVKVSNFTTEKLGSVTKELFSFPEKEHIGEHISSEFRELLEKYDIS
ncbi:MAG: hypothetical protein RI935_23 [Candidatus Parcubacteria bacterium]|jgi:hypothetical protein